MREYKQFNNLKINEENLNCVFMSFYTHIFNPRQQREMPVTMMQLRHDGYIGFAGGKVDPEDYLPNKLDESSLKRALIRELTEEINLQIKLDKDKMEHLSTFETNDGVSIHNFSYELDKETFFKVLDDARAMTNIEENCGNVMCYLSGRDTKEYQQLIKNNFKETALMELELLERKLNG